MPKASTGLIGVKIEWTAVIAVGLVVAAAVWFAKKGVEKVVQAIDPTSSENVFNKAFEKAYKAITGSEQKPGEDLYDLFHKKVTEPPPAKGGEIWDNMYWIPQEPILPDDPYGPGGVWDNPEIFNVPGGL